MENMPITTVEAKTKLAENMIEYHINNMHHAIKSFGKNGHFTKEVLHGFFESMNWCCEHSPVEGTVEISFSPTNNDGIKHISVPVATYFGVVCTKEKEQYKITWSYSLS